ncbi:uncharacterized protein LOC123374764 isoform X3 [Mauremys mutica]|uniref:uncharacterized protein LOC123374764 isoform X3 n=1 Tax=Mauremys mutica TaxID=74926 RepID=UPI001D1682AF|nr:uncharacterized protein LOC123374764 isoform X3 [Mauremys mutica]
MPYPDALLVQCCTERDCRTQLLSFNQEKVKRSAWSLSPDPSTAQEEKVLEQGEQMMDAAEGSPRGTSPPPHDDPEEPDCACQEEPGPAAAALATSAHLPQLESHTTLSGMGSTILTIGSRISHWRLAHQRGYHVDQLTQAPAEETRAGLQSSCAPAPLGADGGGGAGNLDRDPERLPAASGGKAPAHSPYGAAHGATETAAGG